MDIQPSVEKLKRKHLRKSNRKSDLAPNLKMWDALQSGVLLNKILAEFYLIVFKDHRLKGFFENSTIERAIEKQYLFLKSIFTGERCYFGERPRNGHNRMIISDELFDYREELLESVLRNNGLSQELIQQWRAVDETYRKAIVKSKPIAKKINGVKQPIDGYGEEILASGTVCDQCENEIAAGCKVCYQLSTGKTYCNNCKIY